MGSSGQSDSSSGGGGAGSAPRGLYMHGGVGVGKTMLMDLLASSAPSEFKVCPPTCQDITAVLNLLQLSCA